MSQQKFDEHLREQLAQHPSPLDTGALWDNIAPRLEQPPRKRRGGLLWWRTGMGSLLLVGLLLVGYLFSSPLAVRSPQRPTDASAAAPAPLLAPDVLCPEVAANAGLPTAASPWLAGRPGAGSAPSSGRLGDAEPRAAASWPVPRGTALPPAVALPPAPRLAEASALGLAVPTLSGEGYRLPVRPIAHLRVPTAVAALLWEEDLDKKRRRKPKPLQQVLRAEAAVGAPQKTLDMRQPVPASEHLLARRDTERPLEFVSAQLLWGLRHRTGLYALTGLGYTSIQERFSISSSRTETDTLPNGITEIYIDAVGDSLILRGDVPFQREISYRKQSYGALRFWDIPVIAGWEMDRGRWGMGAEAGLFINVALRTEGDILDASGTMRRMEDGGVFRARIRPSFYSGVRVQYALGTRLHCHAAATLRLLPRSIAVTDYELRQSYVLPGLALGLSRRF